MELFIHDVTGLAIRHGKVGDTNCSITRMTVTFKNLISGEEGTIGIKLFTNGDPREIYHHADKIFSYEKRGSHDNEKRIKERIGTFEVEDDGSDEEDTKVIETED